MDNRDHPEDLIIGRQEDGRALAEVITRKLFDTDGVVSGLNPGNTASRRGAGQQGSTPGRELRGPDLKDDPEQRPTLQKTTPPGGETEPPHRQPDSEPPLNGSSQHHESDLTWLDDPQTLYLRQKLNVADAPSFVGNLAEALSSSCVRDAMKKVKLVTELIVSAGKAQYPVFAIDPDGKVIAWNKEMERITGVPAHSMIGKGEHAYAIPFYGRPRPMLIDYLILPPPSMEDSSGTPHPGSRDVLTSREETVRLQGRPWLIQSRGTRIYDEDGNIIAAVQSIGIRDPIPEAKPPVQKKAEPERAPAAGEARKPPLPQKGDPFAEVQPSGWEKTEPERAPAAEEARKPAPFPRKTDPYAEVQPSGWEKAEPGRVPAAEEARKPPLPRRADPVSAGMTDSARNEALLTALKSLDQPARGQAVSQRHEEVRPAPGQLRANEDDLRRNMEAVSRDLRPIAERRPDTAGGIFENVVMDAREGIVAYDTGLRCILWNTFMEHLTGIPAAAALGRRAFDMFPMFRDAGASLLLEQALSGKTVESSDLSCHLPPEKQAWVRLVFSAMRDRSEHISGVIGIVQDTTARKVREYALQTTITQLMESEEKYRNVFTAKNDPLLLIDTTSRSILDLNKATADLYGYPREEFFALSLVDLFTEPEHYKKLLERQAAGVCMCRQRKKDGTIFPADISYAYFELKGHLILILSIRDLSTSYQTADALRLANTKLNLLIGVTRHDVINNLTVLMGYNDLLKHSVRDPKILEMLAKEEVALQTIHRQIEFTREYYNLGVRSPLWQNICETSTRAYSQFITTIGFSCNTHDLEIYADPLLEKVFYNLFDNAIRHGENITHIRIYCVREGPDLLLIFGDDGQGIPPENKERIFKRGFGKHTGLGLFLSREILAITRIEISETGEFRKGARFELRIPAGSYRFLDSDHSLNVSGSQTMNLHA
jgi:PAS domain S-box-containing protein